MDNGYFANDQIAKEIINTNFILDSTPIPKFVIDKKNNNFIDINESALDFYEYSKSEFLALKITDIILQNESQIILNYDLQLEGQTLKSGIEKHRLKSGKLKEVKVYPLHLNWEEHRYIQVTIIDMSEHFKLQNELHRYELSLAEANVTLKKVISTIEDEKNLVRLTESQNIDTIIRPLLKNILPSCPRRHPECEKTLLMVDKLLLTITRQSLSNSGFLKEKLSHAEVRICTLIHAGSSLKEISTIEGVSINTVKTQVKSIRKKLGIMTSDGALKLHLPNLLKTNS